MLPRSLVVLVFGSAVLAAGACGDDGSLSTADGGSDSTGAGGDSSTTNSAGGAGGGGEAGGGGSLPIINEGFIGGPCAGDADCAYDAGFCLPENEGFPDGMCSLDCDLYCPDQDGAVATFCANADDLGTQAATGLCTTRCDYGVSPTGCREGYQCQPLPRHDDPDSVIYACVPGTDDPFQLGACHQELLALGIAFTPAVNPNDSPAGYPNLICDIEDPVWIDPVLNGVTFRPSSSTSAPTPLFVACPFALALDTASSMLADRGATDLVHYGTYNCRVVAGTSELSEHGLARAIDIGAVRISGGATYSVLNDWEIDQPSPVTAAGIFLRELVQAYHLDKVFNIILTPDYNAAHADHFHCDLTPGADFLK